MPYVEPTAESFKARFPEFASTPDALVNLVLAEAIPQVGETWLERDRAPAIMWLTAHLLALQGYPSSTGGAGTVTGPIKRRKTGDVEVEFAGVGGGSGGETVLLASTAYGKQFLIYRRRNFSAIAVV